MKKETETPTCEQLEILTAIADRVLMEFRVDKLGLHLKKMIRTAKIKKDPC